MFSWRRKKDSGQAGQGAGKREQPRPMPVGDLRRLHLRYTGQVQGVGFRWTAQHTARDLGLTGWVYNDWDGSVVMELQGTDGQISEFFGTFGQQWKGHYAIHYTIDEKEDIEPDPKETDFSIRY